MPIALQAPQKEATSYHQRSGFCIAKTELHYDSFNFLRDSGTDELLPCNDEMKHIAFSVHRFLQFAIIELRLVFDKGLQILLSILRSTLYCSSLLMISSMVISYTFSFRCRY